jgi:glycosyltransferase involved in cell wall biosynthesis
MIIFMEKPEVSVIVCTRNRSQLLEGALEAILAVNDPGFPWELLIIDNSSTDDTLEVAQRVAALHPHIRVEIEGELGLSAARNAGIRLAQGDYLVFVDDDAFPEPGWLQDLVEALQEEGVMASGGPVDPLFEGQLPTWFGASYLPYITVWDLGPKRVELAYNEYPRGANMAFRREVFERFGGFSHHLGRRGRSLLSCEETELCLRIERGGGKVIYTPGARVKHRVNADRITEEWLLNRFGAQGRSEAIVDWQHGSWAGLRWGFARFRRNAASAAQAVAEGGGSNLLASCQQRSRSAYLKSALLCPFVIPRYRPGPEAGVVKPWADLVRALG